MQAKSKSLRCLGAKGFHRVNYLEWGETENPRVIICVHGLTRNSHDFDFLATRLADRYRVLCPDVVGRGVSDWLADPAGYGYSQYLSDMTALIARSDVASVDWIGTSMGGLIGMMLAAQDGTPLRRLIVNDIGPFIPREALARIGTYLGSPEEFANHADLEARLRVIAAPFGPLTDAEWSHLARHSTRKLENGKLSFAYDPSIAQAFSEVQGDIELWPMWDAIQCPTLVLRGAESDLLCSADAQLMTERGPQATLHEFVGVGHAPMLMADEQIAVVEQWLAEQAI